MELPINGSSEYPFTVSLPPVPAGNLKSDFISNLHTEHGIMEGET